jgi:hypothetical protein
VATDITQMRLERTEEGVFLSANVRFELPGVVEDALLKGISMYFVAEADVLRDRWYWYDKKWPPPRATCACPTSRSRAAGG